jgi:hypothetical protein
MARPRGRHFPKGFSGNPGGRPAQGPDRRKIEADARPLARSCGPEAVEELRTITAPYMAKIIAANSLLARGWGRPPVSVEVYEADLTAELIC